MSLLAGSLGDTRRDTITSSADNIYLIDSREAGEIVEDSRKGTFKKNWPYTNNDILENPNSSSASQFAFWSDFTCNQSSLSAWISKR